MNLHGIAVSIQRLGMIAVALILGFLLAPPSVSLPQDTNGVSFHLLSTELSVHEPVIVIFQIRNSTAVEFQVDLGRNRKENFQFVLTLPDGTRRQLPRLRPGGFTRVGVIRIAPGQTYTERLVLNEWTTTATPGRYDLEAMVLPGTRTSAPGLALQKFELFFNVGPRNETELLRFCQVLNDQVDASKTYEQRAEAATELSYVQDDVAVPFLERLLSANKQVESFAILGLERIGSVRAIQSLAQGANSANPDVAALSRASLQRIQSLATTPSQHQ